MMSYSATISIHAPREGSDLEVQQVADNRFLISIHAPREGSDTIGQWGLLQLYQFLSTLPVRGATQRAREAARAQAISIHAPREGSDDQRQWDRSDNDCAFLSTLPVRGATAINGEVLESVAISIHAPREGSDRTTARKSC